jgi:hypothetical protein
VLPRGVAVVDFLVCNGSAAYRAKFGAIGCCGGLCGNRQARILGDCGKSRRGGDGRGQSSTGERDRASRLRRIYAYVWGAGSKPVLGGDGTRRGARANHRADQ